MEYAQLIIVAILIEAIWENLKMIWKDRKISLNTIGVLVISIIAIVGIIGIIGYRIYKAYYIKTGALTAATEFEQSVQNNNLQNDNTNSTITNIPDTFENTDSSGSTEKKTTYKGFAVVGYRFQQLILNILY